MSTIFVIYTSQRTGSTMLCDVLGQIEKVKCYPEIFRDFQDTPPWLESAISLGLNPSFLSEQYRQKNRFELFTSLQQLEHNPDFFGFKLMSLQDHGFLEALTKSTPFKVVHLYRENLLAVYGAAKQAKVSGKAHVRIGEVNSTPKVKFDRAEFEAFLQRNYNRITNEEKALLSLKQPCFSLEYKELSNENSFQKLFNFLEIKAKNIPISNFVKRNTWQVLDRFSNPDSVNKYLTEIDKKHWCFENHFSKQT